MGVNFNTNSKVYFTIVKKEDIIKYNVDLKDKSESLIARYILIKMLDYFDIETPNIIISKNGKPYFEDSNIFFNYSHSKKYIACGISNYELGIDIEETDRIISDSLSKKYLNGVIDNKKRIEQWVKKEAYSKMKGLGLLIDFKKLNLDELSINNKFAENKDYMYSIFCDGDVIFKELRFDGAKWYE